MQTPGKRARPDEGFSFKHPLGILPKGNLLCSRASHVDIREPGLGALQCLDDTLLLEILALLDPRTLLTLAGCSKTLFAFSRYEPLWKDMYLSQGGGILPCWYGNWRKTYVVQFLGAATVGITDCIQALGLFSDVLFQPYLCSRVDVGEYFLPLRRRSRSNISRVGAHGLQYDVFLASYANASLPVIITNGLSDWPASSLWTPTLLREKYYDTLFRAEALDCTLETYLRYAQNCDEDDSPLYLFDSRFVEKTGVPPIGTMGTQYSVPSFFREDLFGLMQEQRPDYRWLIIGPARSGSTFHKDPNHTSAWNAVLSGRKGWVMFPPDVLPPGVYVTPDEAEVTSPLAISEWFLSYFDEAWQTYGPNAREQSLRGKMKVGICEMGEMIYVPSGWWHLVVNLDFSVAVTQNYVSTSEIGKVLAFMHDRPEQVSGFKRQTNSPAHAEVQPLETPPTSTLLFDQFCQALREGAPDILEKGLMELAQMKKAKYQSTPSLWDTMKPKSAVPHSNGPAEGEGFSFDFEIDE